MVSPAEALTRFCTGCRHAFRHFDRPFETACFNHQKKRSRIFGDVLDSTSRSLLLDHRRERAAAHVAVQDDAQRATVGRCLIARLPCDAQETAISNESVGLKQSCP